MEKIFPIILLLFAISLSLPLSIEAGCEGPIVTCGYDINGNGQVDNDELCNLCHLLEILNNILELILTCLAPIIGGALIVLGGLYMVVSGISPPQLEQGKKILRDALIGIVIVFGAWVSVGLLLTTIGIAEWTGLNTWWEIDCTSGVQPGPIPGPVPCGLCEADYGNGCVPATTKWGENLYGCEGDNDVDLQMLPNTNKRCVNGVCRTCDGFVYSNGTPGCVLSDSPDCLACWYSGWGTCSSICGDWLKHPSANIEGSSCVSGSWDDTYEDTRYPTYFNINCVVCRYFHPLNACEPEPPGLLSKSYFPGFSSPYCYLRGSGSQSCGADPWTGYGRICVCEW